MKLLSILSIASLAVLSSCSSAYRTAQTPDDLYYSPSSEANYSQNNIGDDQYYAANTDDQYLMMKVRNPDMWSTFDYYGNDAYYSPYSYGYTVYGGFGMGYYSIFNPWYSYGYWNPFNSMMNSYYLWNNLYNPYYAGYIVASPKYPSYYSGALHSGFQTFNSTAYSGNSFNNRNTGRTYNAFTTQNVYYNSNSNNRRSFSNQNSNFNNNNNNNNNNRGFNQPNNNTPVRSYTPSNFGGGGNSGGGGVRSSGGGGGFSRPGKG